MPDLSGRYEKFINLSKEIWKILVNFSRLKTEEDTSLSGAMVHYAACVFKSAEEFAENPQNLVHSIWKRTHFFGILQKDKVGNKEKKQEC